jgi:hypothetical protein
VLQLQGTPLAVTWMQVGGPKAALAAPHASRVTFKAPVMLPDQAGWEGLARALIAHPDFLLTRPAALAQAKSPEERARLQPVKVALDLVGRSPTVDEVDRPASIPGARAATIEGRSSSSGSRRERPRSRVTPRFRWVQRSRTGWS